MKRPQSLIAKVKVCDPELRFYVIELEKENIKLHKQKAELHVKVVSQQNEITAIKKFTPEPITVVVSRGGNHNNLPHSDKKC